ncbi:hypothetical protein Lesp02_00820 [Lentzea sp. NBRC 105346]|uniref:CBS domain-containing protein n=1 Tax=Lentzea sp. NBRC 105346 TaxID=3032205 RepID=UPI0024A26D6E|nr:CBS domain-containing protein [Lentzea sp. NBRC 105346]GLZ27892.1 hypothetical protein Lesp02_00820 [Lentzea sp. NBRC 105346]
MSEPKTIDVMCRNVVTAVPDTPFKELVATVIATDVRDIPVIDPIGRPLGVVSEADLATKLEFHGGAIHPPLLGGSRWRAQWHKAAGTRAGELMTAPAVVVTGETPLRTALHVLTGEQASMLCVVNEAGTLVGVLRPHDTLRVFLRGDDCIRADVERQLFGCDRRSCRVAVHVADGVVTLEGALSVRSAAERAEWTVRGVPGVIAVRNNLDFDVDDLMITGL